MGIPPQYVEIVARTITATEAGRVKWQESAKLGEFFVAFEEFALVVSSKVDTDGVPAVVFGIRNSEGELADSFYLRRGKIGYDDLNKLNDLARRAARRIDDAIARITKQLEGEGDIGADVIPKPYSELDLPF